MTHLDQLETYIKKLPAEDAVLALQVFLSAKAENKHLRLISDKFGPVRGHAGEYETYREPVKMCPKCGTCFTYDHIVTPPVPTIFKSTDGDPE